MFIPFAGAEPPRITLEEKIVAFIKSYQAIHNRAPLTKEIEMSLSKTGKINNRIREAIRRLKQSGRLNLIYLIHD